MTDEKTHFLNVDLDIESSDDLGPLAAAVKDKAFALSSSADGPRRRISLELNAHSAGAEIAISEFVALVRSLPADVKALWDQAGARHLNVGIQGGREPHQFVLGLPMNILQDVVDIG